MNAIDRNYLNTKETADEFSFSVSTLTKLRVFGGGPLYFKLGRRVVYRRQDVEAWISKHACRSTSEGPSGADLAGDGRLHAVER